MASVLPRAQITIDAYLAGEQIAEQRHEYLAGEVYAMVGASDRHNLICLNLATALRPLVRGTQCQLFMADMKLRLEVPGDETFFYYPDLMLACDPTDREPYYRRRPCLLVEVASPATERIDRREKLFAYMGLPSLEAYLLLAQDQRQATLHRRADGWSSRRFASGDVPIDCLNTAVALDLIYEDVIFS